jgi:hypothetical protein
MSAASKAGLLKRLHADGADTFTKKVKWVAKHIPTITDPQAYVGWLTREERTSMATKNPTAREHQRFAEEELAAAEEAASMVKLSADVFEKAEYLLKAFQHSVCAEREAGYAQHALGRKEGAGINYKGMIKAEKEAHALADKAYRQIRPALEAGLSGKAKNPAARSTAEMQQRKAVKKAAMHEAKTAGRAARAAKKASGHNYVVCDSSGKAIALTTTLAEARKTVPKGGCVEKI